MKKFLHNFFMVLGVIFFLLIVIGAYLWIADPFEVRPLLSLLIQARNTEPAVQDSAVDGNSDANPLLDAQQEQSLRQIGIDPAALPSKITPAMETCFYDKLGTTRANEIKDGAEPTAADYFKARSCLNVN